MHTTTEGELEAANSELAARDQMLDEQRVEIEALRAHERCVEAVRALADGRSYGVARNQYDFGAGFKEEWTITVFPRVVIRVWASAVGPTADAALDDLRAKLATTPEPQPETPATEPDALETF